LFQPFLVTIQGFLQFTGNVMVLFANDFSFFWQIA